LVSNFSYLGVFIVCLVGASTIILPLPIDIFIFGIGALLNPYAVGIIAGFGASIGELTSYGVGFAGRKIYEKERKKPSKRFSKFEKIFKKYGFWSIPFFAFIPLTPVDIVGLFAGSVKYSPEKFFIGVLIGKIPRYLLIALAGHYSIIWVTNIFY